MLTVIIWDTWRIIGIFLFFRSCFLPFVPINTPPYFKCMAVFSSPFAAPGQLWVISKDAGRKQFYKQRKAETMAVVASPNVFCWISILLYFKWKLSSACPYLSGSFYVHSVFIFSQNDLPLKAGRYYISCAEDRCCRRLFPAAACVCTKNVAVSYLHRPQKAKLCFKLVILQPLSWPVFIV